MTIRRKRYSVAALLLCMFLVSCEKEKISDINADPGRFHGKEIQIAGKVTQSIGALGKGVYQLNDGSGSLWVYSDKLGVPSKGVTVGVKGTILPTFTFLGVNYATVLHETDRRSAGN